MGKKTTMWIILVTVFCCGVMALVDGVAQPSYGIKSVIKIGLFLMVPFVLSLLDRTVSIRGMFKFRARGMATALVLGAELYALILGAYFVAARFFDFSGIARSLSGNLGVDGENFLWVAVYISFLNSLLEEFFFRGFVFTNLRRSASRPVAYGFSAAAFALYHVAMMIGWFPIPVYAVVIVGLSVGGLIFNYLNEKFETLYVSWFVHVFASFAINTVGFLLLR